MGVSYDAKCAKESKLLVVLDYHIMKTQKFPMCVCLANIGKAGFRHCEGMVYCGEWEVRYRINFSMF